MEKLLCVGLTNEDEQHPDNDLQDERDADECDKRSVEGERRALLQHGLQLRCISHQQRYVQHALCCALLISVGVHVERVRHPSTVS